MRTDQADREAYTYISYYHTANSPEGRQIPEVWNAICSGTWKHTAIFIKYDCHTRYKGYQCSDKGIENTDEALFMPNPSCHSVGILKYYHSVF